MNKPRTDRAIVAALAVLLLVAMFAVANHLAAGEPDWFRLMPPGGKP